MLGVRRSASTLLLTPQEWTEAKELLRGPEKDEEDVASRDPGPEPPSRRLPRIQDKAGKPPRIREEL